MADSKAERVGNKGKSEKKDAQQDNKGSLLGKCFVVFFVTVGLCIAAIVIIPSPTEPVAYSYPKPLPKLEGPLEPNEKLRKAKRLFEGEIVAPESITADPSGVVFSGLADGRIVKFVGGKVVEVARTGSISTDPPCGSFEAEPTCGRPLGMRFDRYGVNLIVADAYYGLLKVDTTTGTVSTLVSSKTGAHGVPFKFVNDLDIDRHGTIYFTDTSVKWDRRNHKHSIMEGEATGRLLAYHKSGELEVLIDDLQFANGVQVSHEGDAVLVAETTAARIRKYYIKGKNEGKVEIFMENLPGLPDNIRQSSNGGYWIGIGALRKAPFSMIDWLAPRPFFRKIFSKLIPQEMAIKLFPKYGLIIEVTDSGRILRSFHDPGGKNIAGVSEVHEEDKHLYLGSYHAPFLGRLDL